MSRRERRLIDELTQENKDLKQLSNLLQFLLINNVGSNGVYKLALEDLTIGQVIYSLGLDSTDIDGVPVDELPDVLSVRIHDVLMRLKSTGYLN